MSKVTVSPDSENILKIVLYFGVGLIGEIVGITGVGLGLKSLLGYIRSNGLVDVTIDHTVDNEICYEEPDDISAIDVEDYTITDAEVEGIEEF